MYKFKQENQAETFCWNNLGDIKLGRVNLGEDMPVSIYRLFQFTIRDILTREFGIEKTCELFRSSGELAGREFCKALLDKTLHFDMFIAQLQSKLKTLKIGILRIEKADLEMRDIVLTIEEDLDCAGLPITDESVCDYDEGFISGIFSEYTGKPFNTREIDCWATGARICRFKTGLAE